LVRQPTADVAPAPVVVDAPRPSLLRQATAAMARQSQTAPAGAQPSWPYDTRRCS
jgi:hypothetical protein